MSQETNQVGRVGQVGEGYNQSHQVGIHLSTCEHPRRGATDGVGLKWIDSECLMGPW